jgi:tripartite-type tricarboxylate transporter receptor subunit TctC
MTGTARADDVADFYKGKQISVVVGYGPGGGYDLYARLLARHMGKYIPGAPTLVVQNMPGAGSLRATNWIYNVAPKDGTAFGIFARNMPLLGILGGNPAVQYDPMKFTYLGSSSSYEEDAYVLFLRPDAPNKTVQDATKAGGPPLVLGGTGEGSTGNDIPLLLKDALGLNIRLVAGYPDANGLFLAIERGEIEGRITDFSSVKANRPHWVKQGNGPGTMSVLLQFARRTRHPDLPNVPTARELATTEKAKALIALAELPFYMSRPFAAPPGIPADRAKALQKAFMEVHKDTELLAEAQKQSLGITPVAGSEFYSLIEQLAKSPPELLDYVRKLQDANKG